jgi:hypothetical protein
MGVETQRVYNCRVCNGFLNNFELQAAVAMLGGNILFADLLSRLTQAAIGAKVPCDEIIDGLSIACKRMRKYKKDGG